MAPSRDDGALLAAADEKRPEQALLRQLLLEGLGYRLVGGELERHGLDPSREYHAIRARPSAGVPAALLSQQLNGGAAVAGGRALFGTLARDICGIVEHLPVGPLAVPVGVSEAVPVSGLTMAFAYASRAHRTAMALGRPGLNDLGSLGIYPSVLADTDVGAALIARYITPIRRIGTSGEAILRTVEHYMKSGSALAETASDLGLHVNTVRSRLRRFEDVTGRSLQSTEVLAEIWWTFSRARLVAVQEGNVG